MRKSTEIAAELRAAMGQVDSCPNENRNALQEKIEKLTNELSGAQASEAAERALANQNVLTPEQKAAKNFSITKFLREISEGNRLTGVEAELESEARKEMTASGMAVKGYALPVQMLRAISANNATTNGEGKELATVGVSYVDALRANLVMSKLGATYMSGLQGQLKLVKGGGAIALWEAEGDANPVAKLSFNGITMTPKRLQAIAGFTGELLHQSSPAVDQLIYSDLIRAHASALDAAAIYGGTDAPKGILGSGNSTVVSIGTNGGALTLAQIVALEEKVASANGLFGSLAYLTNPKVVAHMKSTAKVAGYPSYLLEDGKVNGYDVLSTSAVPSNLTKGTASGTASALIFGNFNEVVIGQWGGLDVIVDPYTSKNKGIVEVSVVAYHDIAIRRPECFASIQDIVIA